MDEPSIGSSARLAVHMNGRYDSTATGILRLRLPDGLSLVSGDTLFRGHPAGEDNAWVVTLKVDRPGHFEIHGRLEVTSWLGTDEGDVLLAFESLPDTAMVERSRVVRSETVRDGQRYRYGGQFLIPIQQREDLTQNDIERFGQRASGPQELKAVCTSCNGSTAIVVRMVAFVAADGKLVESRTRIPDKKLGKDLITAAKIALNAAHFRPARLKGKTVADWVLVDVRVVPSK